jgi:hypothetical protein
MSYSAEWALCISGIALVVYVVNLHQLIFGAKEKTSKKSFR